MRLILILKRDGLPALARFFHPEARSFRRPAHHSSRMRRHRFVERSGPRFFVDFGSTLGRDYKQIVPFCLKRNSVEANHSPPGLGNKFLNRGPTVHANEVG